jgi:hypothetical protein
MGGGGRASSRRAVSAMQWWARPTQHTLHEALLGVVIGVACRADFEVQCTFSAHSHVSDS